MEPRWTTDVGDGVSVVRYLDEGTICAVVDGDAPEAGPGVRVLSAADGSEIGYVPTTGGVGDRRPEYHEDAGLVLVTTDEDHVHAIDLTAGTEQWEIKANNVTLVTDETAFLCAGATLLACRTSDGTREWKTTLPFEVAPGTTRILDDTLLVEGGTYGDRELAGVDTASGVTPSGKPERGNRPRTLKPR